MRIKHIYITKDGEPMANPEMEYPTFNAWRDSEEVEEQAKAKYHSGLLPFEDMESVLSRLPNDEWGRSPQDPKWNPDTLIPVDIEAEVVEKWNANGIWLDRPEHRQGTPIYQETKYEYRSVLRIKP